MRLWILASCLLSVNTSRIFDDSSSLFQPVGSTCRSSSSCAAPLICATQAEFLYITRLRKDAPDVFHQKKKTRTVSNSGSVELNADSIATGRPGELGVKLKDPLSAGGTFNGCLQKNCLGRCLIRASSPPPGYYRVGEPIDPPVTKLLPAGTVPVRHQEALPDTYISLSKLERWLVRRGALCHPGSGVSCKDGLACREFDGSGGHHFCVPHDFVDKWQPSVHNCTGSADLSPKAWSKKGTCKQPRNFELRCYRDPRAALVSRDDGKCFIPRRKKCDPESDVYLCRPGTGCDQVQRVCLDLAASVYKR